MTSRTVFLSISGGLLLILVLLLVVRPALERGGATELFLVAVAAISILLFERWLRTR